MSPIANACYAGVKWALQKIARIRDIPYNIETYLRDRAIQMITKITVIARGIK